MRRNFRHGISVTDIPTAKIRISERNTKKKSEYLFETFSPCGRTASSLPTDSQSEASGLAAQTNQTSRQPPKVQASLEVRKTMNFKMSLPSSRFCFKPLCTGRLSTGGIITCPSRLPPVFRVCHSPYTAVCAHKSISKCLGSMSDRE